MLWLALTAAIALQDDLCPLQEGTAWTYETKERNGPSEAIRETVSRVRGLTSGDWLEVTDFLFYEMAYVRTSDQGFEFRAPEYGEHSLLLFKRGARVGDSWISTLTDEEDVHYRVEAEDQIDVPAGRFRAFRVSFVVSESRPRSHERCGEGAIWFSPGTGIVKGWIDRDLDCHAGVTRSFALKSIEKR